MMINQLNNILSSLHNKKKKGRKKLRKFTHNHMILEKLLKF